MSTEISRRQFMAKASVGVGSTMSLGLAIPLGGSLIPDINIGRPTWTALDEEGWRRLQVATDKPVQIDIQMHSKDAYLTAAPPQSVWAIKVKNQEKFIRDRADLFGSDGNEKLSYSIVNLGFVLFSPICPHLGCYYEWKSFANRFICPCHGSQFNYNGAHLAGPAARGLDPLPLREQSGLAQCEWIRYEPTIPDRIVISYIG